MSDSRVECQQCPWSPPSLVGDPELVRKSQLTALKVHVSHEHPEVRRPVILDVSEPQKPGRPIEWTSTSDRALELVRRLYELEPAGGPLHVEVDDGNLDGEIITPHYSIPPYGLTPGFPDDYSTETHVVCDELAALLTAMTPPQRQSVIAVHDGLGEIPHWWYQSGDDDET